MDGRKVSLNDMRCVINKVDPDSMYKLGGARSIAGVDLGEQVCIF